MDGKAQGGLLQPLTGPSVPRFFRKRFESEDALKIHVALSVSLFLLNLTFFINLGHDRKLSLVACWARGAIFHYFLLCVFTWMGLEAFHLYLLVIRVFNTYFGHYFLKLSLVGWGRCCLGGQRGWLALKGQGEEQPRGEQWLCLSDSLGVCRMGSWRGFCRRTCHGSPSNAMPPPPTQACPP